MEIKFAKMFSKIVSLMLIAAVSLTLVSCAPTENETDEVSSIVSVATEIEFTFTATLLDGTEKTYTVKTDKTVVGDALKEEGLISGTEDQFGLYVNTVCGEYHKWEDDGKYWAFYIDGKYAMTGVDKTKIEEGRTYSFKVE